MARIKRLVSIVGVVTLFGPMVGDVVFGYSGGPVRNVTDLAPTCAGCHSSFTRDQLRNEPEAFATSQIKENKHYKAIEDGIGPYQQMSAADRQKLLADVKAMDENASMALSVPTSLRAGQEVQVTVSVKGGHGVVGVLLVDTDLRFQARPIQGDGWVIVGAPKVWGGDGNEQTKWVDSRAPGLKRSLNSVLIFDRRATSPRRYSPRPRSCGQSRRLRSLAPTR